MSTIPKLEERIRRLEAELGKQTSDHRLLSRRVDAMPRQFSLGVKAGALAGMGLYGTTQINVGGGYGIIVTDDGIEVDAATLHTPVTIGATLSAVIALNTPGTPQGLIANAAISEGDLWVADATPNISRLAVGSAHQLLKMNGAGASPAWSSFDWDDFIADPGSDMVHDHSIDDEGGTVAHSVLTGVTANQHHNQLHASEHEVGGGDLVNHDSLTGFVANEHINHSTVVLTAGNGLSGGGSIIVSRTIVLGTPSTLTASTSNGVTAGSHTHAITDTSDGAANHSTILSSDASGRLTLDDLIVPNGGWVGIGSALERVQFYTAGYIALMDAIVGVGTATPNATSNMHIYDAANAELRVQAAGVNSLCALRLINDARHWNMSVRGDFSDSLMIRDETAGAWRVTVTSAGDVGIGAGATSPNDVLHVEGAVLREGWFCGHAASQAGFTGALTDIDVDTEIRKDSVYYMHAAGSDDITITEAGWYRISYAVGVTNSKAGFTVVRVRVYDDGAEILQSGSMCSINDSAVGGYQGTCSSSFIVQVGAGSVIDLRTDGRFTTGSFGSNCDYDIEAQSQITIERIDE